MYSQIHHLQTGGLYLKNVNKKGFKPILDMILHPGSTLKNLTYDSLKGVMVVLTIDRDHSEYNYLSETTPRTFTKPVTDYLLKIAVVTETEKNLGRILTVSKKPSILSIFPSSDKEEDGILKYSETKESFIEEARIQQKIWYTSLSNGKDQLCPSIANFSLFTNKNSKGLINILKNKTTDDVLKNIIFNWIYDTVNDDENNELGIITMPLIQQSTTFGSYIDSYENGKVSRKDLLMSVESFLIQIIRLWIDHRIYHADLHTNNCLIYKDDSGEIKCVVIDFGRVIDFTAFVKKYQYEDGLTKDFFISLNERMDRKIRELNFTLLSKYDYKYQQPLTRSQKIDGIERLYKDTYDFDSMYYKKVYDLEYGNSYDYYKLITSLAYSEKSIIFERVYNKLHKMFNNSGRDDQNREFFIKKKNRFMLIDSYNVDYYYNLNLNLNKVRNKLERKRKIIRQKTIKKKKVWRKNIDRNKPNNILKRFFFNNTRKI